MRAKAGAKRPKIVPGKTGGAGNEPDSSQGAKKKGAPSPNKKKRKAAAAGVARLHFSFQKFCKPASSKAAAGASSSKKAALGQDEILAKLKALEGSTGDQDEENPLHGNDDEGDDSQAPGNLKSVAAARVAPHVPGQGENA